MLVVWQMEKPVIRAFTIDFKHPDKYEKRKVIGE